MIAEKSLFGLLGPGGNGLLVDSASVTVGFAFAGMRLAGEALGFAGFATGVGCAGACEAANVG